MNLMVVVGSVRQGSNGSKVGQWVKEIVEADKRFNLDHVEVKDLNLPFYDDPNGGPTALFYMGKEYQNSTGRTWADRVAKADAIIFITAEYNRSFPASLKNAIDWVGPEWNGKIAGTISYGYSGQAGVRAFAALLPVYQEVGLYAANHNVHIDGIFQAFDEHGHPNNEAHTQSLTGLLDEIANFKK